MDPSARTRFEDTALPYLDALFGMALRMTRNRSEAEDLVQDTMVRAYRFWSSFQPGTSAKAWLFTILRNTYINRYKRAGRARQLARTLEGESLALGDDQSGHLSVAPPLPDQVLSRKITREHIDEALAKLPDEYKIAVTLADIEGMAYKEIAAITKCPIGTVMSRIYRGRKRLHKLLYSHALAAGLIEEAPATSSSTPPISLNTYRKRGSA
jgi:RNA polymerase sigma-70 factor (ECF subfamily)